MPFPVIHNLPSSLSQKVKAQLKRKLITDLAAKIGIDESSITPIGHSDSLSEPQPGKDTIYVSLDSGMFVGTLGSTEIREKATKIVAQIVFEALNGVYDVECFIGDINSSGKTMLHRNR